ncbi:complexin-1 [Varanus komodoensis]|uniref:complexin-1 n=1 Tax=Varanus komodoensis TaxID=61221 RepID=UPI001CF7A805|nr:complexin-1 [Varanus komodoensis]
MGGAPTPPRRLPRELRFSLDRSRAIPPGLLLGSPPPPPLSLCRTRSDRFLPVTQEQRWARSNLLRQEQLLTSCHPYRGMMGGGWSGVEAARASREMPIQQHRERLSFPRRTWTRPAAAGGATRGAGEAARRPRQEPQSDAAAEPGATKDMGKMLGGEEEKDPDAAKKEEERQEALRQQEEERKAKYAKMEAERETVRQGIRDKYGIKKKEEREAEAQAALEANVEGSLTRPKKAIPPGCGDEDEEEDESILDTVIKYLPGPLQDMFKK